MEAIAKYNERKQQEKMELESTKAKEINEEKKKKLSATDTRTSHMDREGIKITMNLKLKTPREMPVGLNGSMKLQLSLRRWLVLQSLL